MNWISVDERLPELPASPADRAVGVVVLVSTPDGRVLAARWVDPPQFGRHARPPRWEEYDGSRLFRPAVTHWMPLPPPPAGSSDRGGAKELASPSWSGRW